MATYTDNYTMTKPTYAEQADISVINANMDIIDNVMHSSQISLAPAYDLNETYNTGDVVMHELLMYKCLADNVTGAWDSTKWERTTASETGGGADFDIYGEASGTAEASFSDGAEASLVECGIGIVPTQDLHGYSKPWAGGAGKNIYDGSPSFSGYVNINNWTLDSETYNGHEVIYKSSAWNGVYKLINLPTGTYTFSVSAKASVNTTAYIYTLKTGETTATVTPTSELKSITTEWTKYNLTFDVTTAGTVALRIENTSNSTLYISEYQIESGTTATTFEPYSNICPISGHTDVTVTVASTSGGSGDDTTVSLGRTVYKGTVDLATGEGTITGASIQINPNDITFSGGFVRLLTTFSPITNDNVNEYLSSHFKSHLNASVASMENEFTIDGNKYMILKSSMLSDLATAQAFFTNNTVDLFGLLATPQTFTLTKEQIITLLGQNHVSHDGGGTISLVYIKKGSTIIPNPSDAEVPLTGLEISGKGFKITDARIPAPPTNNGAYVLTVTVSGGTPTYSWENA